MRSANRQPALLDDAVLCYLREPGRIASPKHAIATDLRELPARVTEALGRLKKRGLVRYDEPSRHWKAV